MSALQEAIRDVAKSQTWTERLYYISPVAEAAFKALWSVAGQLMRRSADANAQMSDVVAGANIKALAALDMTVGQIWVISGPFKGMSYINTSTGSLLGPKLSGSYEEEIATWVDDAIRTDYDVIIDIGAAEGYYAVGFARAMPLSTVRAFDIDATSRNHIAKMAELNGVTDRVIVGGLCSHNELIKVISDAGNALVFVDIEGFETLLLDPDRAPALKDADIIVEMHDNVRPGATRRLLERFSWSHRIETISAMPDWLKIKTAVARGMSDNIARVTVPEQRRLPQHWMRLTRWTSIVNQSQ